MESWLECHDWSAMPHAGVGPLCIIKAKIDASFNSILEHFTGPTVDKLYGDGSFLFQQDVAHAHTAFSTN